MSAITSSPFVHPGAYSLNRGITYGFIGLSHYVHALWNYSNRGIVFEVYTALSRNLALKNILPAPGPMSVRRFLQQYFLLIPGSGLGGTSSPVYRFTAALGASGVLSALTVCAAAFEPNRLVKPYGIPVPVPMWAAAVGYNFVDLMIMQSGIESQVSHVTHLAGAATGLVWYILLGAGAIPRGGSTLDARLLEQAHMLRYTQQEALRKPGLLDKDVKSM
ncbi:MAG: hypothetical protein Q9159_001589 [Coniocarpon cinnabarinum]